MLDLSDLSSGKGNVLLEIPFMIVSTVPSMFKRQDSCFCLVFLTRCYPISLVLEAVVYL